MIHSKPLLCGQLHWFLAEFFLWDAIYQGFFSAECSGILPHGVWSIFNCCLLEKLLMHASRPEARIVSLAKAHGCGGNQFHSTWLPSACDIPRKKEWFRWSHNSGQADFWISPSLLPLPRLLHRSCRNPWCGKSSIFTFVLITQKEISFSLIEMWL